MYTLLLYFPLVGQMGIMDLGKRLSVEEESSLITRIWAIIGNFKAGAKFSKLLKLLIFNTEAFLFFFNLQRLPYNLGFFTYCVLDRKSVV